MNSQTHAGDMLHASRVRQGILKSKPMGYMNRIDIGTALAQLYTVNPDTFHFLKTEKEMAMKGYGYIGSIVL